MAKALLHTVLLFTIVARLATNCAASNATLPFTSQQEEHAVTFSYDPNAPDGPSLWATLDPSFVPCSAGLAQSPVDIPCPADVSDAQFVESAPLLSTTTTTLKFERTIGNFELACESAGSCGGLQFNGKHFELDNIHFHSPSEHNIGGVSYPLEAHMVHASSDGALLVLSIMFSDGSGADCITSAPPLSVVNAPLLLILLLARAGLTELSVNTGAFVTPRTTFSMYNGSLTTPPCSERVTWLLAEQRQTISAREVDEFLQLTDSSQFGNARPLQPLNARPVLFGARAS
eukprot:TRINITY_DN71565_c0_g1_i1.p1 TRINITY_DN71565_c0_g1~~TRINITY_DN71565_c0_g1_i1.p1  ORF type:complete len:288 (-),score=60.25 TRINITY_DN71565_c0_g1_i1:263-1126(-)